MTVCLSVFILLVCCSEEVGDTMARIYAIKQSLNNKASVSGTHV